MNEPVLEATDLRKDYVGGDGAPIHVLTGVQLTVSPGEFVAIIGASGSGKSTLLHLLGALDDPSGGDVTLAGQRYAELSPAELAALRNRQIGFVFQFHHLLRDFTALENVMMPLLIAGAGAAEAGRRARAVLETMGLGERLLHRPGQLSGGEQQRVAVARALAPEPALLLADEPSGNLDPANAERLHGLLAGVSRDHGRALVVVTHNRALADLADRVLALHEGVLALPRGDEVMAP
ncbi:MAG TPA: ABC transporter ATP-binding protein [Gemmatimonadales bacterium]